VVAFPLNKIDNQKISAMIKIRAQCRARNVKKIFCEIFTLLNIFVKKPDKVLSGIPIKLSAADLETQKVAQKSHNLLATFCLVKFSNSNRFSCQLENITPLLLEEKRPRARLYGQLSLRSRSS